MVTWLVISALHMIDIRTNEVQECRHVCWLLEILTNIPKFVWSNCTSYALPSVASNH